MASQEHKYASRFTLTVAQGITLLRARSVAISVEMETTYAGNVMSVGRMKLKKVMMGFMISSKCGIVSQFYYITSAYSNEISSLELLVREKKFS
jgi:hypothetical protein